WYPVRIDRFADGFFVVAAAPAERSLLGAEVIRIGDRLMAAVWDSLLVLAPGDNVFSRMARVTLWLMSPAIGSALGTSRPDVLELTVRVGGREETRRVPSVPGSRTIRMLIDDAVAGDSTVQLSDENRPARDWSFQWPSDPYWYRLDQASGIAY